MPDFNQLETVQGIPPEWLATQGKKVRVAVIDSGALLEHPALRRYDLPGHKWDARLEKPTGDDDVNESKRKPHGTMCAGVVTTLAPEVDMYFFRAFNQRGSPLLRLFLSALNTAIKLNMDIVSVSFVPRLDDSIPAESVDAAFRKLKEKKTLLVTALENTDNWDTLKQLLLPTDRPEALTAGVATHVLLEENMPPDARPGPGMHLLMPERRVAFIAQPDEPAPEQGRIQSSWAAAALSGTLALLLAHEREKTADPALRLTKSEVLARLPEFARPFDREEMTDNQPLLFYHNQTITNT